MPSCAARQYLAGMATEVPHSLPARCARALRLKCPACGSAGILVTWFRLAPTCPSCAIHPNRGEPDHFYGGYVINLVLAEGLAAALWFALLATLWPEPPWDVMQWAAAALMVLCPVALYPFTRLLFLAVDLTVQPRRPGDFGEQDPTYK